MAVSRKQITVVAVLVFFTIGVFGAVSGVSYLMSDQYCKYCHSKPDKFNNTLAIRHYREKIGCFDCHYTRDFTDTRVKEILNYTFGYGGAIHSSVGDSECQKCHYGNISSKVLPHYYTDNCTVCHDAHRQYESSEISDSLDCYICHAPESLGGKHAAIDCIECHIKYIFDAEKHASIPECSQCHEPHTEEMTSSADCMLCHPAHSPLQLKTFPQNVSKSFCAACHLNEYEDLGKSNQKHNYFNGSVYNQFDPDWYLKFNSSCVGCHPSHGSALKCAQPGCHYADHIKHKLRCIDCHYSGYPPKMLKCTQCHPNPHIPLPAVAYTPYKKI